MSKQDLIKRLAKAPVGSVIYLEDSRQGSFRKDFDGRWRAHGSFGKKSEEVADYLTDTVGDNFGIAAPLPPISL